MALRPTTKAWWVNFAYGIGAAIVIIGALFKITHFSIGPLSGNLMLAIGLITEAVIFVISAFSDAPSAEYDWEKVYPELATGAGIGMARGVAKVDTQDSLSDKFDKLLSDAKLDVALFERLRVGIDDFGTAVQEINKTATAAVSTQKYGEELAKAAENIQALNAVYQMQLENGNKQVELNKRFIEEMENTSGSSEEFMKEMKGLTENINNLNKVYGGMLSAMKNT